MSVPSVNRVVKKLMKNGRALRPTGKAPRPPAWPVPHTGSPDLIASLDREGFKAGGRLVVFSIGVPADGWGRLYTFGAP